MFPYHPCALVQVRRCSCNANPVAGLFPELKLEVDEYVAAHRQHRLAGSTLANGLIQDKDDHKRQAHYNAYISGYHDRLTATSLAQGKLNAAARRLLAPQIVGVER